MSPPTVQQALAQAAARGLARLDAQWLLADVLAKPRAWLLAHDDRVLSAEQHTAFVQGAERRAAGEPLAYVLGRWEFCGLTLEVNPAVLVPRPETEDLVRWALACLPKAGPARVLDLGTGSGAIALALKHARPELDVHASDVSPAVLALAQRNAARLQLPLHFHEGPWWQALPEDTPSFDLIVSNPPYIAEGDAHLAALSHEPALALTSGPSGLDALTTIVAGALRHLKPGAWLLLEHGHDQQDPVGTALRRHGFTEVQTRQDLAGLPRCSGGRKTGA